jgi:hypothetical protein
MIDDMVLASIDHSLARIADALEALAKAADERETETQRADNLEKLLS